MKRSQRGNVVLMAVGILLGMSPVLSADDGKAAKSPEEFKSLVNQLGTKRFQEREQATHELSLLGKAALPDLRQAALSPDAEIRRRAQQLVERIEPPVRPNESVFKQPTSLKSYL